WHPSIPRSPDGRTARLPCALLSATLIRVSAGAVGDAGTLGVINWIAPQFFHRLRVRTTAGRRVERVAGEPTYDAQLRAFARPPRRRPPATWGRSPPCTPRRAARPRRVRGSASPRPDPWA